MKNHSIKQVVAIGIGSALFVVIGMINIPTPLPNTSIQLQYALQALFALIFGPVPGLLIGLIGHALKDAIQYGNPWWTWVVASGLFGWVVGLLKNRLKIEAGLFPPKDILTFNLVQVVANVVLWGILAPLGDILIYHEATNKVFAQGALISFANSLTVAIAGTLLILAYSRTRTQAGSLKKD